VDVPVNGLRPPAAITSNVPKENMSLAGVSGLPSACSGDMNPGEPMIAPVCVSSDSPSTARAMPKSITRGPSPVRMTLLGLRSRCTSPARWMSPSARASPAAR
jgi:hypothetical protein